MFSKNHKSKHSLLTGALLLSVAQLCSSPAELSTWNGSISSDMNESSNWDDGIPYGEIAVFNGNGDNSPLSRVDGGLSFQEMQFNADTQVSIISSIQTSGDPGVIVDSGTTATFEIYEHQPLSYPPASMTISNGPAGDGGGTVEYNLEGYGQLYASSGSSGDTIVNITMTEGNNYLEITEAENGLFDNVNSDAETDEIRLSSGSTLTIRGSNTNAIDGVITGSGSLVKSGTGTLILNHTNTFTGETTVDEGILQVNGSLFGDLTVNAGGSLKGSGTINGNVALSGTVSPGNSIGTLNVGSFTFTSSSVFDAEVNSAGASDQIIATDGITVAGTLNVIPLDLSFTAAQTYAILEAGSGISGTFSTLQSTVPALMALDYDSDEVSLTYLPLSVIGLTGNADAAANCFVSLSGSDAMSVSEELLSLSFSDIQQAFNHIQPSQLSGQTWTQISNALLVRSTYSKHLEEFALRQGCSNEYRSNFWIDGVGQWQQQHKKHSQIGYNDWTGGVSLGADTSFKQFRFGGAASYTHSGVHWSESAGKSRINSYYGGLYGGWSDDIGYISFSTLGAYNHYNSSRHLNIGDIHRHANASHHGWEFLSGLEGGAHFKTKHFRVGPFGRVDYVYLWQNGYQEHGSNSLDLSIESRRDQLIQSQAGIVFTNLYECSNENGTFIPRLELSYINQTPLGKSDYKASFENSSCEFSVSGWNFERNLGAVGASLTYLTSSKRVGISLQYDGQFGTKYSNQSGNVFFNVKF